MSRQIYQKLSQYISRTTSRRDFIQAVTALGLSSLAAESLLASVQPAVATGDGPQKIRLLEGTGGELLVKQLKAVGVKYIFHTNTSGMDTIAHAVDTDDEMQFIIVTHEGQAVSTLQGYTLATGDIGFFIANKVGVGNSISNLFNAWKDKTPLLATFRRSTLKMQGGRDPSHEWDEHLKPTEPFTAWNWSCVDAETIPETLCRAIQFAYTPPGAPVTLSFPQDLLTKNVKAPIYEMDPKRMRPMYRADQHAIEKAAKLLAEARNPLFLVGPEVSRERANPAMVALAEKLSVPVCQVEDLFCDFPSQHPLCLGEYELPLRFPQQVDLVINFGARAEKKVPDGARHVHISSDPDLIGRRQWTDLAVIAHVSGAISDLSDALDGLLTQDRIGRIRRERLESVSTFTRQVRKSREMATRGVFDHAPISWQRVGYELEKALDKGAVIVPELGSQNLKLLNELRQGEGEKLRIGRTTGSALGWGVGAALGVQLALPDRQVVALQGDGGILFGQTETLWSIARYQAPMLIVVMNNHSYNETRIRNLMDLAERQYPTDRDLTGHLRDLTSYLGDPDVDFSKIAAGYSIKSEKVYNPGDLSAALERALKTMREGQPYLLDVEVERDGLLAESTWHPEFSIAKLRNRA